MTEKEFKILLDKFLNGTISKEEEAQLIAYEEQAINDTKADLFLSDLEKKEVKKNMYFAIKKKIKPKRVFKISIAASIVLLIGLGSMLFFKQQKTLEQITVSNNSNGVKEVILTDGSLVILNKNSALKYNNNFNGTRHLDLVGEAFFKVKRNEKKPFIVKTQNVNTKVLGTSFNIADHDSIINVTVATGLVQVFDANYTVLLKPNEQTIYKTATKSFTNKKIQHELFVSWFKETTYLEKVSMKELTDFFKRNYGVQVDFLNQDLENVQMSITINKNESLESLLKKINYISELKLTLKQNNMIEVK
ncbi:FecR family protein [Algibacter pacificus]|uniref:FecR family protein n=1 Tax=Algibacter pacificus TaxID=2599389 RepID=UPI0011C895C4|nr:FecR family protein [Algibacter pacificus]